MNSNRRDFLALGMGAALASVPGFVSSQESGGRLPSIGSTRGLEILPLVDWLTASPQLRGEAGVSYLVRTDGHTVLFDVGGNFQEEDLSPLIVEPIVAREPLHLAPGVTTTGILPGRLHILEAAVASAVSHGGFTAAARRARRSLGDDLPRVPCVRQRWVTDRTQCRVRTT